VSMLMYHQFGVREISVRMTPIHRIIRRLAEWTIAIETDDVYMRSEEVELHIDGNFQLSLDLLNDHETVCTSPPCIVAIVSSHRSRFE
jgi:hypothetical protein